MPNPLVSCRYIVKKGNRMILAFFEVAVDCLCDWLMLVVYYSCRWCDWRLYECSSRVVADVVLTCGWDGEEECKNGLADPHFLVCPLHSLLLLEDVCRSLLRFCFHCHYYYLKNQNWYHRCFCCYLLSPLLHFRCQQRKHLKSCCCYR